MTLPTTDDSLFFLHRSLTTTAFAPIQKYSRLKYTCFDVSSSYLAFGSSSGGIYLFERDDGELRFLQMIPQPEGRITAIAFCPHDEQLIAFSTANGTVIVAELQFNQSDADNEEANCCKNIYVANNFTKDEICFLKWDSLGDYRLFISDDIGNVYFISRIKSLSNLLVSPEPALILKLGSKVTELDVSGEIVAASTLERAIVHDMNEADLEQIGKKRRPNGDFGVCLFPRDVQDNVVYKCIYASRPGARIWESDLRGNVQFTHQFKSILASSPPADIITFNDDGGEQFSNGTESGESAAISATFAKFCVLSRNDDNFLLGVSQDPSLLVVIDPVKASVILWTAAFDAIEQIRCVGGDIFLLHRAPTGNELQFSQLSALDAREVLFECARQRKVVQLNRFLDLHRDYFADISSSASLGRDLSVAIRSFCESTSGDERDHLLEQLYQTACVELKRTGNECEPNCGCDECPSQLKSNPMCGNDSDGEGEPFSDDVERRLLTLSIYGDEIGLHKLDATLKKINTGIDLVMTKVIRAANNAVTSLDVRQETSNGDESGTEDENSIFERDAHDRLEQNVAKQSSSLEPSDNEKETMDNSPEPVEQFSVSAFIEQVKEETKNMKCDCGLPRPNAIKELSDNQRKLADILKNMSKEPNNHPLVLRAARDGALWDLYSELLLQSQDIVTYIDVALLQFDVQLLNSEAFAAKIKYKSNMCLDLMDRFVLAHFDSSNNTMYCPNCSTSHSVVSVEKIVSLEDILKVVIEAVGASQGMSLLRRRSELIPIEDLPASFFLSIVRKQVVTKYQSAVTWNRLSQLNEQLNRNSPNVAPSN